MLRCLGVDVKLPEKWPPKGAPPLDRQSKILELVDNIISKHEEALVLAKKLRLSLLLGWGLANHEDGEFKYHELMKKGYYVTHTWSKRQLDRIKQWRDSTKC